MKKLFKQNMLKLKPKTQHRKYQCCVKSCASIYIKHASVKHIHNFLNQKFIDKLSQLSNKSS